MTKLDDILKLANLLDDGPSGTQHPFGPGQKVIIRTVTHYYTGQVESIDDHWIALSDAAWIADTGRWAQALANGTLSEIEPYPNGCWIAGGSVVDVAPWDYALPRDSK